MENTVRPVPLDIIRLRSATVAYLSIIRDVLPAIDALGETGAELGMTLEQAQASAVAGSPGRIAAQLAELLGETAP